MANILVLDVGSSSIRAGIYDERARLLAETAEAHVFTTALDGASEADARRLRASVEGCVDRILAKAPPLAAVVLATFVGNLLGVDAENQPVTPIFTYADTRPAVDVAELRAEVDVSHLYQATGCPLHTAYHPARLRWYARTGRPTPATWLDFGTYLLRGWFGRDVPCCASVASWSGLLDRGSRTWSTEWLRILGLSPLLLPPLGDFKDAQFGLARDFAKRWPALRDVPFFLPVGDGAAAHVGSGAVAPRQTSLTVGSTAALRQMRAAEAPPRDYAKRWPALRDVPFFLGVGDGAAAHVGSGAVLPRQTSLTVGTTAALRKMRAAEATPRAVPEGLWAYRIDEKREVLGGATSEGGNVYAWAWANFGIVNENIVFGEPFAHGLTVLPMFAGERSPGFRPDATATLHGLRLATSRIDIIQALLESIALRLSRIHDLLGGSDSLHGGGGALSASPAWAQMIADATQTPVLLMGEETTARGAAMLALEALGKGTLESLVPPATRGFEPRAAHAEVYREAKERQIDLYRRLYGELTSEARPGKTSR